MPRTDQQGRQWIEPPPVELPAEIAALGFPPIVADMLARRGIVTAAQARAFLDPSAYTPADPFDLPDMDRAVDRLISAIQGGDHILIWGDFDVDGQTSTALLVSGLTAFGASVVYHIPDREREGHGIDIGRLADRLAPLLLERRTLIVTCDTGIAAHEAIRLASSNNVDVIVTDHHNLPDHLPPALANVNPQRLERNHPLATLPGVGVAYQLIAALVMRLGAPPGHPALLESLTDLTALGIVADVAVIAGDTRYLLQRGLIQIRGNPRPGIIALIELARLDPLELGEEQIGFALAPRLNALGRLADASQGVELLLSTDIAEARVRAVSVEQLNAYRKLLSDQVYAAAVAQVEKDRTLLDSPVLVLGSALWSPGVVGIVANRLVELYNRPVFLFGASDAETIAPSSDRTQIFKGSARSVNGIDVTAALNRVNVDQPGMLMRFGGHIMAAGMSIQSTRLSEFRGALNRAIKAMGVTAAPPPSIEIAAFVRLEEVTLELADTIGQLAPFGPGNPPVTLAVRDVTVRSRSTLGRGGDHLRVSVRDSGGHSISVLWWNGVSALDADPDLLPEVPFDLAFTARSRSWKGKREVQLEWRDSRVTSGIARPSARPIDLIDMRGAADPVAALHSVLDAAPDAMVYAEGSAPDGITMSIPRQSYTLVIWTTPYSRSPLEQWMSDVHPGRVILFCIDPELDRLEPFLFRLGGLVKYAIQRREGEASVIELARAMAHSPRTVQFGLAWLAAKGIIEPPQSIDDDHVLLETGRGQASPTMGAAAFAVQARLAEAGAYRQYLRTADVEAVKRQLVV